MSESGLPDVCSNCGEPLSADGWNPLRATTDPDGTFRVHAFCDEACLEAWEPPNGDAT